jgi:hypothetical protein
LELALTTLLLLPGVVSLALATGPRCRAIAPRDLPAALVATLGFALLNCALTVLACKLSWGAPRLGSMAAALLTGKEVEGLTRESVLQSLFEPRWQHIVGLLYLTAFTWATGRLSAVLYVRLLRLLALQDIGGLGIQDQRSRFGRFVDDLLDRLGFTHLAIARGASYWLVVEQSARLLADKQPEVYADISQGDTSTLFAGQVAQVITSPSGETLSIVLKKARRYRRTVYSEPDSKGEKRVLKPSGWTKIGDSEAFYIRGENVHNISYRVYGDPARGGYFGATEGTRTWSLPEAVLNALKQAGADGEQRRKSPHHQRKRHN